MSLDCWLATPGRFFNAQPLSPAPKELPVSKARVSVGQVQDTVTREWRLFLRQNGVEVLRLPQGGPGFSFQGQTAIMTMPTADIVVLRYTGTDITAGDMVRLFVVDMRAQPVSFYEIGLGPLPLRYNAIQFVEAHPSPDSRLLFVHVRSGATLSQSWRTHWHRVICTQDGAVLCQHDDHVVVGGQAGTDTTLDTNVFVKFARVTANRMIEMLHFPGLEPECIFQSCPLPAPPSMVRRLRIDGVDFNPAGPDIAKERVILFNAETTAVPMDGWTLRDAQRHVYSFPAGFSFPPQSALSVWTRKGTNGPADLFMGYMRAIWNNSAAGDQAELRDEQGRTVSIFRYTRPAVVMPPVTPTPVTPPGPGPATTTGVVDEFYVRVDGRDPVRETDVPFGPGDRLRIRAEGQVFGGTIFAGAHGPGGASAPTSDRSFPLNGTSDSMPFALIGKLGFNGRLRFIGESVTLAAPASLPAGLGVRRLFLGVNDSIHGDNAGEFHVTVQKLGQVSTAVRPLVGIADQSFFLSNGAADLDTGIVLQRGDRFRIEARGRYTPGGILGGGATDPDGWPELALRDPRFPLGTGPNARKFALVFRYGGMPFYRLAGSLLVETFRAQVAAPLLLRINDDTTGGEAGGFDVRVRVQRPSP